MGELVVEREGSSFIGTVDGVRVGRVRIATRDGHWELYSTVVEPEHQHKGYAGALVRAVVEEAKTAPATIIPTCSYVARWFEARPEERFLLDPMWHSRMDDGTFCATSPLVLTPEG